MEDLFFVLSQVGTVILCFIIFYKMSQHQMATVNAEVKARLDFFQTLFNKEKQDAQKSNKDISTVEKLIEAQARHLLEMQNSLSKEIQNVSSKPLHASNTQSIEEIKSTIKEIVSKSTEIPAINHSLQQLQMNVGELKTSSHYNVDSLHKSLQFHVNALQTSMQTKTSDMNRAIQDVDRKMEEQNLKALHTKVNEVIEKYVHVSNEVKDIHNKIHAIVTPIQPPVVTAIVDFSSLESRISTLNSAVDSFKSSTKDQLSLLQKEFKSITAKDSILDKTTQDVQETLSYVKQQFPTLSDALSKMNNNIKAEIAQSANRINNYTDTQMNTATKMITTMNTKFDAVAEDMTKLQASIADHNRVVVNSNANILTLIGNYNKQYMELRPLQTEILPNLKKYLQALVESGKAINSIIDTPTSNPNNSATKK